MPSINGLLNACESLLNGAKHGGTGAVADSETAQFSARRYLGDRGASFIGARFSRGFGLREITNVTDLTILQSTSAEAETETSLGKNWRLELRVRRRR